MEDKELIEKMKKKNISQLSIPSYDATKIIEIEESYRYNNESYNTKILTSIDSKIEATINAIIIFRIYLDNVFIIRIYDHKF